MSDSDFEPDELQFCPICQVPLKSLKIMFVLHINKCDVRSSELEDCADGVDCNSNSVFHYRDFSHRILAAHRENLSTKRKRNEIEDAADKTSKPKLKENKGRKSSRRRTVAKYNEEADDDDNIFVTDSKKICNVRTQTLETVDSISNGYTRVDNTPVKETRLDHTLAKATPQLAGVTEACSINTSTVKNEVNEDNSSIKCENTWDIGENSVECEVTFEDTNQDEVLFDSSDWEDIEERINESVEKKAKCKAEWSNIFKSNAASITKANAVSPRKARKRKGGGMFSKEPKVCPSFKKIPGTGFAVDAFQFGSIPGIAAYFLSHFHLDHYIGLKKSFSHPIYCSLITANLVKKKLRVNEKYLNVLELNQPVVIHRVEVTCFDANHCPGALIILFRLVSGEQFLHVGDFRACPQMEEEPELQRAHIDRLYLDTTYFNPKYVFPTQKEVVDRVKDIVRELSSKHERALFVSGTFLIGKEKVFLGMLDVLKCKLWALPPKVDVFRCVNNEVILSALTNKKAEAKIHVLPMNHLRFDRLQQHLLDLNGAYTHVFAFRPTGWEMGRTTSDDWVNSSSKGNITIYGVPYSEHSNFEELCRFIKFVKADKIIPTVPMKNGHMYGLLKSLVDSYKVGAKQQRIDQFMSK